MDVETPFGEALQSQLDDRIFKRKLVLWYYYTKDLSQKAISEGTAIPTSTINDVITKWKTTGLIDDLPRSGRSREITSEQEDIIIDKQLEDRTKPATSIHKEIVASGSEITYDQTLRTIHENFNSIYARYKVKLFERNRLKRIGFCEKMLSWRNWKWCDVIWTDEKIFHTEPQNQRTTVKILFDENPDDFSVFLKQQGGEGVMLYCAVSIKGKIYFDVLTGIIDSGKFAQFL